jgi:alpha/beta superfamily hydrolase
MHDGVVQTAQGVCCEQGIASLKFNFRGVGASRGISGRGDFLASSGNNHRLSPEVGDVLAAYQWLRHIPEIKKIAVIGYSFGANMLWQAIPELLVKSEGENKDFEHTPRAILIAPPNAVMQFNPHNALNGAYISAIAGANDDYVDLDALASSYAINIHRIHFADHFFSGQHQHLSQAITKCLIEQGLTLS